MGRYSKKTRCIFEIVKGVFNHKDRKLNDRISTSDLWCQFENVIYIGDGPTDVPSLSLVKKSGGTGIAVFNPSAPVKDIKKSLHKMCLDQRADFITTADFSFDGELFKYIESRCWQFIQRFESSDFDLVLSKKELLPI